MQQGRHSSSKSRNELFDPPRESASGLLVFPYKQPDNVKGMENNLSGHMYNRPSHSGPLVQGPGWVKVGKDMDEQHLGSNRVNLSKLSGLVASRTSLSEYQEEKSHSSRPRRTVDVRKSVESTSGSELRRQAQKHQSHRIDLYHVEHGRTPPKESTPVSFLFFAFLFVYIWLQKLLLSTNNAHKKVSYLISFHVGPYFRKGMAWETRSIFLVHWWCLQTRWIRWSKNMIERFRNIQDELELTSQEVKKFEPSISRCWLVKYTLKFF